MPFRGFLRPLSRLFPNIPKTQQRKGGLKMNCRNDFFKNGEFTMSTNFLTRVLTKAFTFILISTLLTFLVVTIHASDALCLDASFGADGRVTTRFTAGAGDDVGSGIAVQADDKIVVVGTSDDGSGSSEFAVARFNDDGSLDTSFNVDGMVTARFTAGAGDDVGLGIAVQADDKIVVVGTSDNGSGNSQFAVARYLSDLSFTGGGGDGDGGGGGGGGGGCFIATAANGSPIQP